MGDTASFRFEKLNKMSANIENKEKDINLSDSDIKYLLVNNADDMTKSFVKKNELDSIVNQAVKSLMDEYEKKTISDYNIAELNRAKNEIIPRLLNTTLTLNNYEDTFGLKNYIAFEIPSFDENTRNIRYKDKDGTTVAIIQIDSSSSKLRLQAFGNIFPKQDFCPPKLVNYRLTEKAKQSSWNTEDGGINQFNGNIETRYKDSDGNVMAAIIVKPEGKADTVVEYFYENGKKTQMHHTSQYGHTKTFYDIETDTAILVIDIDTDGNICGVVKGFSV